MSEDLKRGGGLRLLWPRRGEAWLDGLERGGAAIDPGEVRALLEQARSQGARVVRAAVAAGGEPAGSDEPVEVLAGASFQPGPMWLAASVPDLSALPAPAEVFPGCDPRSPAWRPRRISAGQWRNPRVRLAVQDALERAVRAAAAAAPGAGAGALAAHAPYGLVAAGQAPFPLVSFGPFDLVDAMGRGEVVTAGDPARPNGIMLLRPGAGGLLVCFLGGSFEAAVALLDFAAGRARQLALSRLEASLALVHAGPLPAWLDSAPAGETRRFRIYEAVP